MPDNMEVIIERLNNLRDKVNDIHSYLVGDGSEEKPGLIKDVDRLKQNEHRRNFVLGAGCVAFIGLLCERAFKLFQ